MEKKHREKICNTGKTQGILSRLERGHPVSGCERGSILVSSPEVRNAI